MYEQVKLIWKLKAALVSWVKLNALTWFSDGFRLNSLYSSNLLTKMFVFLVYLNKIWHFQHHCTWEMEEKQIYMSVHIWNDLCGIFFCSTCFIFLQCTVILTWLNNIVVWMYSIDTVLNISIWNFAIVNNNLF